MSLPGPSHPCWTRLASGALKRIRTEHLGTQLLIKQLERSTDPVPAKAAAIHGFFSRWQRCLGNEVDQLMSL